MKKNFLLKTVSLLCVTAMLICCCSCSQIFKTNRDTAKVTTTTVTSTAPSTTAPTTEPAPENDDSAYPLSEYERLSEAEKTAYDSIVSAIEEDNATIVIDGADMTLKLYDRVLYYAVLVDHPEYYNYYGYSAGYSNGDSIVKAYFNIKKTYSDDEVKKYNARLDEITEQIKQSLPEDNDYQKALTVYDYIIDHCDYDEEYANANKTADGDNANTIIGALIEGSAVCTGYSRAYNYLLDRLGIKATCVHSSEHEWNLILINGKYYYCDLTWSDTPGNKYRFFCTTTEEIEKEHKMPADKNLPIIE